MGITLVIIGMLTLSVLAPFIALHAVTLVRKGEYKKHLNIQKRLFWACFIGLVILEVTIRISGGSGSLVAESSYIDTLFFKILLTAHIIGAVATFIIWGVTVFVSNAQWKKKKTLPGSFSKRHKTLGKIAIIGLFYIAITAILVCVFAFIL